MRSPRMPRIEELPVPVQDEIRKTRGDFADQEHPEKRRLTLLQRLASVGLGRRDDEEEVDVRPVQPVPVADRPPARPPAPRPTDSRGHDPVSEYARRTGPQPLDAHGRQSPVHNAPDEDELDIPAFLRRQAN
jgi:cell division protein FtsZ